MSNFGLSCDVCNRENVGITWVNGMKFCAKCYQETFNNKLYFTNETGKFVDLLNTEMYELKISNLEHKLEEKDQRISELEDRWQKLKECVDKELQKDIKRSDLKHESFVICEQFVLDKMQELDKGE